MLDLIMGLIFKILGIFFIILVLMIVISFLLIFFIFLLFFGLMKAFYYIIDKYFESRLVGYDKNSIKKTKQKIIKVFGKKNNLDNQDYIEKVTSQDGYKSIVPLNISVGVPICSIEISKNLLPLVDEALGKELITKIDDIREEIFEELGLMIPPIEINDNSDIEPNKYIIKIKGIKISEGEVYLDKILAIGSLSSIDQLNGKNVIDPIYGLSATWVDPDKENLAQSLECIILKPLDVIAYHLKKIIKENAHKLLDPIILKKMLNDLKEYYPDIVKKLEENFKTVPFLKLKKILENLLKEKIPIKEMDKIIETIVKNISNTNNLDKLTEYVRIELGYIICKMIAVGNVIYCGALDEKLENIILKLVGGYKSGNRSVNEALSKTVKIGDLIRKTELKEEKKEDIYSKIIKAISNFVEYSKNRNYKPVIICSKNIRIHLRKIIEKNRIIKDNFNNFNEVFIISYEEIPKGYIIEKIKIISIDKDDKDFGYHSNINN